MTVVDNRLSRRRALEGLILVAACSPLVGRAAPAPGAVQFNDYAALVEELVTANRILANLKIVDAFGHISARHPGRPTHFLMSRARAPALIETRDITEFDAVGTPVGDHTGKPYLERFIHAAIYAARPDVNAVVHDHSDAILPFSVSARPLRATTHAGGLIGAAVPVWDIRAGFGDQTNMLVSRMDIATDLAAKLGGRSVLLMRGHGAVIAAPSIRLVTFLANALNREAEVQAQAIRLGEVNFLSPGEIQKTAAILDRATPGDAIGRTWEFWCREVGRAYMPAGY
jgi:ribulose-5-phosphate 4-epimerase/fuculose-1-phosphate aldolase